MLERFNGRIEEVLPNNRFRRGEDFEQTTLRSSALQQAAAPGLKGRNARRRTRKTGTRNSLSKE